MLRILWKLYKSHHWIFFGGKLSYFLIVFDKFPLGSTIFFKYEKRYNTWISEGQSSIYKNNELVFFYFYS